MRATKAYIASLGTTGVLLGASILMLAVVSAVVAFDRWPNGNVSTRVPTLVLHESATPISVSATALRGAGAAGRVVAAARGTAPAGRITIPRVAGQHFTGGHSGQPSSPAAPVGLPLVPVGPSLPALPDPGPIITGNPQGVLSAAADGTRSTSGSLGGSVGGVSPAAGQAVVTTGGTAADALKIPLPGALLPGG
jgi:hypothetical protein